MVRYRALRTLTILLTVVGTTGALVAGAAAGTAATRPAAVHSAAATHIVRVRPVDAGGHLRSGYTVTHRRAHAHCVLGSEATGTAYRCFSGNEVLDPCWVQAGSSHSHVVCLELPWSHDVIRLHVTKGYDNSAMTTPGREPWGMRLTTGTRCVGVQGATSLVHGHAITSACPHSKTVLLGEPSRAKPLWSIRTARAGAHGHFTRTGRKNVAAAYFGRPSLIG
jgi:hypothetical protein